MCSIEGVWLNCVYRQLQGRCAATKVCGWIVLQWQMLQTRFVVNQYILCSVTYSSVSRTVCEKMWKSMMTGHMATQYGALKMRFACRLTNARIMFNITGFPQLQRSHDRAAMLRLAGSEGLSGHLLRVAVACCQVDSSGRQRACRSAAESYRVRCVQCVVTRWGVSSVW